jgi:hypothetical protein
VGVICSRNGGEVTCHIRTWPLMWRLWFVAKSIIASTWEKSYLPRCVVGGDD